MGFGVLEDSHMAAPPGTATINTSGAVADSTIDTSSLKKDGDIVLQPQPSDSPNDPLNW
ncbi:Nn.00g103090.m01.CDS01 [Neocucurbitaria sp. VM-36]